MALKVGFIVEAQNKASAPLKQAEADVQRLKNAVGARGGIGGALDGLKRRFEGLDSTIRKFRASLFALTMGFTLIAMAAKKAFDYIRREAEFEELEEHFREALTIRGVRDVEEFREKLHAATKGMVSDFELIRIANRALYMQLPTESIPKIFMLGKAVSQALGIEPAEAIEKLIKGVAGGQARMLKTMGLLVPEKPTVFKEYIKAAGMSKEAFEKMSVAEKNAIYLERVLTDNWKTYQHIFESFSWADQLKVIGANVDNLKLKFGNFLKYILGPYINSFVKFTDSVSKLLSKFKALDETTKKAIGAVGALVVGVAVAIPLIYALGLAIGALLSPVALTFLGVIAGITAALLWMSHATLVADGRAHGLMETLKSAGYFILGIWQMVSSKIEKGLTGAFEVDTDLWQNKLTEGQRNIIGWLANLYDYMGSLLSGIWTGFSSAASEALGPLMHAVGLTGEWWKYSDNVNAVMKTIGTAVGEVLGWLLNVFNVVYDLVNVLIYIPGYLKRGWAVFIDWLTLKVQQISEFFDKIARVANRFTVGGFYNWATGKEREPVSLVPQLKSQLSDSLKSYDEGLMKEWPHEALQRRYMGIMQQEMAPAKPTLPAEAIGGPLAGGPPTPPQVPVTLEGLQTGAMQAGNTLIAKAQEAAKSLKGDITVRIIPPAGFSANTSPTAPSGVRVLVDEQG